MLRKIWLLRTRVGIDRVVLCRHFEDGTSLIEREHGVGLEVVSTHSLKATGEWESQKAQTIHKQKRKFRDRRNMVDEYEYDPQEGFVNYW